MMFLKYNDEDIICCCCHCFSENINVVNYFFKEDRLFYDNFESKKDLFLELINIYYMLGSNVYTAIGVPWGKLYKKSFLINNQLFFNIKLRRLQDNIFNMNAFYYANSIKYINMPLYEYNVNHIDKMDTKYISDADILCNEIMKERIEVLKKMECEDDNNVCEALGLESINRILYIVKHKICHPMNQSSFMSKRKDLLNVLNDNSITYGLYKIRLNNIKNYKYKVTYILFKYKLIDVFLLIYYIVSI